MTRSSAWQLAALWVGVYGAAIFVSGVEPRLAAIPVAAGVAAALLAPFEPAGWRYGTVLAVPLAAIAGAAAVPWAMAGASLVLLAGSARSRPAALPGRDPQWHLMWCRRRDERAEVMVMALDGPAEPGIAALLAGARATDSIAVAAGGRMLIGVMGDDVDRRAVELRFSRALDGVTPHFGWATFPEDGFTLDVLVEQARDGLEGAPRPRVEHRLRRAAGRQPLEPAFSRASQTNRDG